MNVELASWRPLFEFAMVLIVLGLAGCLHGRDRISWWLSQGLVSLGVIVGIAATGTLHPRVDLFSLGMWLPLVALLELILMQRKSWKSLPNAKIPQNDSLTQSVS